MKKNNIYLLLLAYSYTAMSYASDTIGRTFFVQRSQGSNAARDYVGLTHQLYLPHVCSLNGVFALTPGYQSSFNHDGLGKYLFFNGRDTMQFSSDPTIADVAPINFLLNDNFEGTITAQPSVSNIFADMFLYLGLDLITPGLYFSIHTPICRTKWNVDLQDETRSNPGTDIAADQLGNAAATPAPNNSIIDAWNGRKTFFDVQQGMDFARICGAQTKTGLADVEMALGYNWYRCDDALMGLNLRFIVPATDNRPNGEFLFEPINGNGQHFEMGFGFIGKLDLWRSGCDQSLGIYVDARLYHVFSTEQKRTFDLTKNGIGSRYLLFKKFDGSTNTYLNEIVRGPNILTLCCDVKSMVHADMTAILTYKRRGFTLDVGYNFWAITKDNITLKDELPFRTFAVAGNTGTGVNSDRTASSTLINGFDADKFDGTSPADNVYLSIDDIDVCSASHPEAASNKFVVHFSHIWEDYSCHIDPYVGAGFEGEFSIQNNTALSQWAIWAKGGFTFI